MRGQCAAKAPKHKFRFKSKLFSLDATTIKLCLSLFPGPRSARKRAASRCTPCLTIYLLPLHQKVLSRLELSGQQLFQIIQLSLLGTASLDELLNPRLQKIENSYSISLLGFAA
ncbi:hypothetical protein ACUZ9P_11100 [Desulfovibrio sp. QI0430]